MGTEVVRLLLLLEAISSEVSGKKLIVSSLLTMMISEEKNSSALQRFPCLCVVHSIVTRGAATVRVEGIATSNELVVV